MMNRSTFRIFGITLTIILFTSANVFAQLSSTHKPASQNESASAQGNGGNFGGGHFKSVNVSGTVNENVSNMKGGISNGDVSILTSKPQTSVSNTDVSIFKEDPQAKKLLDSDGSILTAGHVNEIAKGDASILREDPKVEKVLESDGTILTPGHTAGVLDSDVSIFKEDPKAQKVLDSDGHILTAGHNEVSQISNGDGHILTAGHTDVSQISNGDGHILTAGHTDVSQVSSGDGHILTAGHTDVSQVSNGDGHILTAGHTDVSQISNGDGHILTAGHTNVSQVSNGDGSILREDPRAQKLLDSDGLILTAGHTNGVSNGDGMILRADPKTVSLIDDNNPGAGMQANTASVDDNMFGLGITGQKSYLQDIGGTILTAGHNDASQVSNSNGAIFKEKNNIVINGSESVSSGDGHILTAGHNALVTNENLAEITGGVQKISSGDGHILTAGHTNGVLDGDGHILTAGHNDASQVSNGDGHILTAGHANSVDDNMFGLGITAQKNNVQEGDGAILVTKPENKLINENVANVSQISSGDGHILTAGHTDGVQETDGHILTAGHTNSVDDNMFGLGISAPNNPKTSQVLNSDGSILREDPKAVNNLLDGDGMILTAGHTVLDTDGAILMADPRNSALVNNENLSEFSGDVQKISESDGYILTTKPGASMEAEWDADGAWCIGGSCNTNVSQVSKGDASILVEKPAEKMVSDLQKDTSAASHQRTAADHEAKVEMDSNKQVLSLPVNEIEKLQKDLAVMAKQDKALYQEMASMIASDYQIVVTPDAASQASLPGGMERLSASQASLPGGMERVQASQASLPGGMERLSASQASMPGGMERFAGANEPTVMPVDKFFMGVQMESMGLEMTARGMPDDKVHEIISQGHEMIMNGDGQKAFGEVMQMAKEFAGTPEHGAQGSQDPMMRPEAGSNPPPPTGGFDFVGFAQAVGFNPNGLQANSMGTGPQGGPIKMGGATPIAFGSGPVTQPMESGFQPAGGFMPPDGGFQSPSGGFQPPEGGFQPPNGGFQQPENFQPPEPPQPHEMPPPPEPPPGGGPPPGAPPPGAPPGPPPP